MRSRLRLGALCAVLTVVTAAPALAQRQPIEPVFSIWDVELGQPVTQIPEPDIIDLACGTNGGPPSTTLASIADFTRCPPEPSGLREVHFAYDDELDYIARAQEWEHKVFQGGTSMYAHPVIVSVLVDPEGIVRGIRALTDDRISDRERRVAVTLARNLKTRLAGWSLACEDLPPRPGENPVGNQFVHEVCTGSDADQRVRVEAYYLRKRGQEAVNRETQQVNLGYFHSGTRLEITQLPYEPAPGA